MATDLPSKILESYNDQVAIYLPTYCQILNNSDANCNNTVINVQVCSHGILSLDLTVLM